MNERFLLDKMIEHGEKMRSAQKHYYACKYADQKKDALTAAKQAEKEFDALLFQVKQAIK